MKIFLILAFSLVASPVKALDQWDPMDDIYMKATDLGRLTPVLQTHGPHNLNEPLDPYDWFKFRVEGGKFYEISVIPTHEVSLFFELCRESFSSVTRLDVMEIFDISTYELAPKESTTLLFRMSGNGGYYINCMERSLPTSSSDLKPVKTYTFDTVEDLIWIPGGFNDGTTPSGNMRIGQTPIDFRDNLDGQGMIFDLPPRSVDLLMFPPVECENKNVFLRVFVNATNENASLGFALLDGLLDGSLVLNNPSNSARFIEGYHPLILLDTPKSESVIPILQVANTSQDESVTVYIDNLEIYTLPKTMDLPSELISEGNI